jgi:ubiquinone/menaquinone biosynthesis C-methylase UbiE
MREPDIHFAPTPHRVVAEMLRLAEVGPNSLVYDLGCGDGRVLIAAAKDCGARGMGVDIDADRIAECRSNALQAGVAERVRFLQRNFFEIPLAEATVVCLYLLDSLNVRLRPKILSECKPGVRVVSYSFEMGEWEADAHTPIAANGVFLWIVPSNLAGAWSSAAASESARLESLDIRQTFQELSGFAQIRGRSAHPFEGTATGEAFRLIMESESDEHWVTIEGKANGESVEGFITENGAAIPFRLYRNRKSESGLGASS